MPTENDIGHVTITGKNVCCIEWKIEDFFIRIEASDAAWASPAFQMYNITWYFLLNPKGTIKEDNVRWLGLMLHYKSEPDMRPVAYQMGLKREDGSLHTFIEGQGSRRLKFGSLKFLTYSQFMKEKNIIAPNGCVTFCVIICYVDFKLCDPPDAYEEGEMDANKEYPDKCEVDGLSILRRWNEDNKDKIGCSLDKSLNIMSQDFHNLLLSGEGSDVVIQVRNWKFLAHRLILSSRSSVFACMFRSDMIEKNEGVLKITDCVPAVFGEFLLYLYTGRVDRIWYGSECPLYYLATKYDVDDLKERCIQYMCREIMVDTFCETMSLALAYNEEELIQSGTQFFVENAEHVLSTVYWKNFLKDNPVQANELYIKALEKHIKEV